MNKSGIIIILLSLLVAAVVFLIVFEITNKTKLCYVRSSELVYNYKGMKEAQEVFDKKKNAWMSNEDTLKLNFQKQVNQYNLNYNKLSAEERLKNEKYLSDQEDDISKYDKAIKDKIKAEQEKMTQGVLNQINSFVEEYAKKNHYTMVFGTTASGNLLYAEEALDITEELLKQMNSSYKK